LVSVPPATLNTQRHDLLALLFGEVTTPAGNLGVLIDPGDFFREANKAPQLIAARVCVSSMPENVWRPG
jgi:hypothetical protein